MAETNHHPHAHTEPTEGDGINYSGIIWFVVVLVVTVILSQLVVWGLFVFMEYRVASTEAPRAALAAPPSSPIIENGRLVSGGETTPQPGLIAIEPMVLGEFNKAQNEALSSYGWINQGFGTVRLPIDRAKALVIERGLPVRPAPEAVTSPAPAPQ